MDNIQQCKSNGLHSEAANLIKHAEFHEADRWCWRTAGTGQPKLMNSEPWQNQLITDGNLTRLTEHLTKAGPSGITYLSIQPIFTKQLLAVWHGHKCKGCSSEHTLNL